MEGTEGTSSQGSASGSLPSGQKRSRSSRYGMYEDIEEIMFGFGDGWPPEADTVELVEKMAVQYIRDLCVRSLQVASITGKLDKECFLYQVRKDRRKFNRAQVLLKANEELKRAQKTDLNQQDE